MNQDRNDIEILLFKYCDGTASPHEIEQVETWMAESDEHRQEVMQIYKLLLAADTRQMQETTDMDYALLHVHRRMAGGERKSSVSVKRNWKFLQRWAAILFIPVTISLLVLLALATISPDASLVTVSTNPGMTCTFRLPDSTLVYLNSNSTLVYPTRFTGSTRDVSLKGEAYFEVNKDADHHFVLSIPDDTKVKVLGTKFNVEAYEGVDEISATLLEGNIHFFYQRKGESKYVSLKPLEKVVYNTVSNTSKVVKTNCLSELAWKDGKIIFNNTSLKEVLKTLEKRFNVSFIVRNKEQLAYRFTGTFVTQRLEQILMNFRISSNINWRFLRESPSNREKTIVELY